MRRQRELGCIDPHGMWPFAPDRESCAKCQAIRDAQRASIRRGLPYGWWKSRNLWVTVVCISMMLAMLFIIVTAWVFDWKPVM